MLIISVGESVGGGALPFSVGILVKPLEGYLNQIPEGGKKHFGTRIPLL